MPVHTRTYLPATAETFSPNVTTRLTPTATPVALSTGDRLEIDGAVVSAHTAYNVVFALIAKVDAAARDVPPHGEPAAGWVVHQPPKVYPALVNEPVLPATVTVAPLA